MALFILILKLTRLSDVPVFGKNNDNDVFVGFDDNKSIKKKKFKKPKIGKVGKKTAKKLKFS